MAPTVTRRRSLRRILTVAAVVVALVASGVIPLWRTAFDRFERSGRLAALVNRRPDKVVVSWASVRSPWPG